MTTLHDVVSKTRIVATMALGVVSVAAASAAWTGGPHNQNQTALTASAVESKIGHGGMCRPAFDSDGDSGSPAAKSGADGLF